MSLLVAVLRLPPSGHKNAREVNCVNVLLSLYVVLCQTGKLTRVLLQACLLANLANCFIITVSLFVYYRLSAVFVHK